jgi:hypothetical protein
LGFYFFYQGISLGNGFFFLIFYIKNLKKKIKTEKKPKISEIYTRKTKICKFLCQKMANFHQEKENTECRCWLTGQGSPPLPPFQVINQYIA